MRNLLTLGLLVALIASPAFAQIGDEGRGGVGFEYGLWKGIGGDHDYSNLDQFGRLYLRYGLSRSVSLDLGLKYGWFRPGAGIPGDDAGLSFDSSEELYTRTWQPALSAIYNFVPEGRWRPWVSGGVGVTRWDVRDLRGEDSPGLWPDGNIMRVYEEDGEWVPAHGVNFTVLLGIGLDYAFSDCFSGGLGVRTNVLVNQDTDNVGLSSDDFNPPFSGPGDVDANTQIVEATLGLRYMFGCAKEAAAAPVAVAAAAVVADRDYDGILDGVDACPDQAEDKDGFQDADGCPDPDNDGDGVLDAADKCPDQLEDKDGFQDADGCPDPDNDGDGVLDAADKCANTPKGTVVDATGCPVAGEIKTAVGGVLVLEGVTFETGSAKLSPASNAILDSVAEKLLAWPDVTIEIGGHTDNTGSADKNRTLSQSRADVVRQYLVDKGVAGNRITAVGYGPDKPIADNATKEGRATNRRVEITRKN